MTIKSLLVAALLGAAFLTPAVAEYKALGQKTVAGWKVTSLEDTAAGNPKWCLVRAPVVSGNVFEVAVGQKTPPNPNHLRGSVNLENAGWQLGPNSAGQAAVEIKKTSRLLPFRRRNSTQMMGDLPTDDDEAMGWLFGVMAGEPIVVRLPNSETFTVPAFGAEVAGEIDECFSLLISASAKGGSPGSRDPFAPALTPKDSFARPPAASGPGGISTDPFKR